MGLGPPWTGMDLIILKVEYQKGTPVQEIADRLNRTPGAIRAQAAKTFKLKRKRRIGKNWKEWTEYEEQVLRSMWLDPNETKQSIAERLGRGYYAPIVRANKLGLGPRKTKKSKNVQREMGFKWKITPWPDDVHFEDNPRAASQPFCHSKALRLGQRFIKRNERNSYDII